MRNMAPKKGNKAGKLFDTISDVGSLFMSFLYIMYVTLLLAFDIGTVWLNWAMFVITFLYIAFFITKVVILNKYFEKKNYTRMARFILRYSKLSMRIINAIFVCIAIATTRDTGKNTIMIVGVFLVGFSFLVSVMWDVVMFIFRRRMRDFKEGWDNLSHHDKNKRVEYVLDSLFKGIDNLTGIDLAGSVKTSAVKRLQKEDPKQHQQQPSQEE
jgi:hypothetical protein